MLILARKKYPKTLANIDFRLDELKDNLTMLERANSISNTLEVHATNLDSEEFRKMKKQSNILLNSLRRGLDRYQRYNDALYEVLTKIQNGEINVSRRHF